MTRMSDVTVTIRVQSDAAVSMGTEHEAAEAPPPMALEELGAGAEGATADPGPPPEDLEVLGAGSAEDAPEPMPLDELDEAAAEAKPKRADKKDKD